MKKEKIDQVLHALLDDEEEESPELPSIEKQKEALEQFINFSAPGRFKVGDYVIRNSWGKRAYRYPHEGQLARISKIFEQPVIHKYIPVNATIIIFQPDEGGIVTEHLINIAYYEKVDV
jgi:hypothetical protein